VTGELITNRFRSASAGRYFDDWQQASDYAASIARPGDLLIPMGGGDVFLIVPQLLDSLRAASQPRS
jgi:UDP-N-acetylmuramate--alanine ligase